MSIVLFIIILGVLVFVHELGHFVSAKKFGIRVDEFALGFPPRLISKKIGETDYSLNLVPIGGYVKIYGENPDEDDSRGAKKDGLKMSAVPKWKQAVVLSSGILGNLLFAFILLSAGFLIGLPTSEGGMFTNNLRDQKLVITSVMPQSPAENSGIKVGDQIVSLKLEKEILINPNGKSASDFINFVGEGQKLEVKILRKNEEKSFYTFTKSGIVPGKRGIGISMEYAGILKLPLHKAVVASAYATGVMTKETIFGIVGLLKDAVLGKASLSSITGPVGIAVMVGDAGKSGFVYLLLLTVLISINLAVINLVPFPALDGGRLFFLAVESIIRKPINPKIATIFNQIGLVVLLLFMAIITYKDVIKLIK